MAYTTDSTQRPHLLEGAASAHHACEAHDPLASPPPGCSWATTAAASPVSRVPYDILRKIMLDSQKPVYCADDIERLSLFQPPLNVSHVSQLWRQTALSTPSLWTRIHFDMPAPLDNYHRIKNSADAIAAMVERSQKCELYISVDATLRWNRRAPIMSREKWEALARAITHPLLKSQQRWKVARVSLASALLPYAQEIESWPDKSLDDLPLLEEFTFSVTPSGYSAVPVVNRTNAKTKQYLNINLSKCPKLKRLIYDGINFSTIHFDEGVILSSLLELMLVGDAMVPIHRLKRIVAASPALQSLGLPVNEALDNIIADDVDDGSFTSTSLQQLYISCNTHDRLIAGRPSGRLPHLLQLLKFPSLSNLIVASKGYGDPDDMAGFVHNFSEFAGRSGFASLTHVTLNLHLFGIVDWASCLQDIPSVVDLNLELEEIRHGSYQDDEDMNDLEFLFTSLTASPHADSIRLCPVLESLVIKNVVIKQKCDWTDSYIRMLVSRSPRNGARYPTNADRDGYSSTLEGLYGTAVLRSATINLFFGSLKQYDPKLVLMDWYAELRQLLDRGLEFSVHHGEWIDSTRFPRRWEQDTRLH